MVSLSRSDAVQSLLARFRPADTTEQVVMSPAPTAVMVADNGQTPPSTQGREMVRYEPSSQHQTRSQQKRIAAAEGGDLQERLNLITIEAAEAGLARRFCKHHPDRSILEYLRAPGDGVAPHQAVTAVLEGIADDTAETAGGLAEVVRYLQVHEMWKTHPDRTLRSAEDFIEHLDRAGFIRGGLVYATTAQAAKRTSVRRIDAKWETDWYEKIPSAIRDETWRGPEDLSRNILARIAATAEDGRSLQSAVEDWEQAIQRRNDMGHRRSLGIKGRVTPFLALADVPMPNRPTRDTGRTGNIDHTPSGEAKEERLQVNLIPRQPPFQPPAPPRSYSEAGRPKTPRKRKRVPGVTHDENGDGSVDGDGWKKSKDGRWLTKRMKNQFIRKPVEISETDGSARTSPDEDSQEGSPPRSRSQASPVLISSGERVDSPPASTPMHSPRTSDPKACAGPAFLKVLRELIKSFSELEDRHYTKTRVCDCCRDSVTATVHSILHEARTNERMLEAIGEHFFGTHNVPPRQERWESPKRPRRWDTLFVGSDSESGDSA